MLARPILTLDPSSLLMKAQNGPLLEAELLPLTGQGKLRITYNWLYSALNCDPSDHSPFVWSLSKLDATHVSLSPRDPYAGMKLYASVRDDWSWYVEVQAPHSADWITGVGGDETLALETNDLMMIALKGFNGQFIAVDQQISYHDDHAGFRLRSVGADNVQARLWFLSIARRLQPCLGVKLRSEINEADIARAYAAAGLSPQSEEIDRMLKHLS